MMQSSASGSAAASLAGFSQPIHSSPAFATVIVGCVDGVPTAAVTLALRQIESSVPSVAAAHGTTGSSPPTFAAVQTMSESVAKITIMATAATAAASCFLENRERQRTAAPGELRIRFAAMTASPAAFFHLEGARGARGAIRIARTGDAMSSVIAVHSVGLPP